MHNQRGYEITNWGNPVVISDDINTDIKELYFRKRIIDFNSKGADYEIKWGENIKVSQIIDNSVLTFKTDVEHNLSGGAVVALFGHSDSKNINWMISKTEEVRLFKVKVLNKNTFQLYEYIASATNGLCCRHIHYVNRQKDGWLIGTGEIYPDSWTIFIQQKECDYFNRLSCNACAPLAIIPLTRSPGCVQRTIGAEFLDDKNIIFASDHPTLKRPEQKMGEKTVSRSSTGIYVGEISKLNDFSEFKCILSSCEVGYFFRRIDNMFIYGGQLGEISISYDNGVSWHTYHLDRTLRCFMGTIYNGFVIDGIVFKRRK